MWPRVLALVAGYGFMYLPLVLVVIYSFNASRLVTVWAGFSPHWYGVLWQNEALLTALGRSLRIAAVSATIATVLGACAALLLARVPGGLGRTLVAASVAAMLVVPEVILGFAQLLTFVSIETGIAALQDALAGVPAVAAFVGGLWPTGRSVTTITLSHITLSMAFVTVVVRSRLGTLDPALEEAAQDLGATPLRVLTSITLPLVAPALAAGWLLAFTLSLDDLVLASFTSGPSSTTLPMVVYSSVRLGVSPQVNALASILIAVVALGIVLATVLLSRGRQRSRERQPAREGLLVQGGQRG